MFWGLIMEPRRRYSQEVTRPFHVSMASLDISSCTDDAVQLMVMFQKRNYLLCTLQKGVAVQVPLDLNFESGDEVSFTINGASHIHLTGYHMEDDFEDVPDDEEEDEEEAVEEKDEEEVEEEENADLSQSNVVYGKRKQSRFSITNTTPRETTGLAEMIGDQWNILQGGPAAKRSKTLELLDNTLDSEDDDSDYEDVSFSDLGEDDDDDEEKITLDNVDDEGLEEEDSEEEEDGEEEQEDEEESEEELEKPIVQEKQTKKQKNKEKRVQKVINQKQDKTPEKPQKQKKEQQQIKKGEGKKGRQQQQQQQQQGLNGTPLSEKKKKKNKQEQNASPAKELNASAKEKKQEQVKTSKTDKKQQNPVPKKFVDRGVTIVDISLGGGPPAKVGKFAHLYYEGRLKQNNKMFDSSVKGPPFKFRLGAAEVIKGWDIGVLGMKIGGKRRITVPPQMAYGSKGIPPEIPPNSTLIFDLELKNVT